MDPAIRYATNLIKFFEGCRLSSYQDSGGVWTIGCGHTKDVGPNQTCTQDQADAWIAADLVPLISLVAGKPTLAAVAYLDFGYNCGEQALKDLLAGKISLLRYGRRDSAGHDLPGLIMRRNAEMALIAMEA